MNDLDFLPADYVCVKTTRTNNNWLRGLFVMVLALMAVGWVAQQNSLRELRARRTRAQENVTAMLASVGSSDQLRADLQRAENVLRIQDGLRIQVPPTRWLSAIVDALPQRVSLVEIHAETEVEADREKTNSSNKSSQTETQIDPTQQDLDRLVKITPRRTVVISIRGSAHNDLEVSQLLTSLHRIDMFDQVQLLFTDQQGQDSQNLRSFAIRLRTRPFDGRVTRKTLNQPVATVPRERK